MTVITIHRYLALGGLMDLDTFYAHAKLYLLTKRLYIVTIDNDYPEGYRVLTNFAILAHRELSALALLDELLDANYNVVSVTEYQIG